MVNDSSMSVHFVRSRTFQDYPDVQRYLDRYDKDRTRCTVTVGNNGFVVDVYRAIYPNRKGIIFA